jgi:hypothetical protein
MINLFLALLWLLGAVVVLAYEYFTGEQFLRIRGTNLSVGWLLLVLGIYNLARWWSLRSYRAEQRAVQTAQANRYRAAHRERHPGQPPDPNFDFTDRPPPRNPNITDRPPSDN